MKECARYSVYKQGALELILHGSANATIVIRKCIQQSTNL